MYAEALRQIREAKPVRPPAGTQAGGSVSSGRSKPRKLSKEERDAFYARFKRHAPAVSPDVASGSGADAPSVVGSGEAEA